MPARSMISSMAYPAKPVILADTPSRISTQYFFKRKAKMNETAIAIMALEKSGKELKKIIAAAVNHG